MFLKEIIIRMLELGKLQAGVSRSENAPPVCDFHTMIHVSNHRRCKPKTSSSSPKTHCLTSRSKYDINFKASLNNVCMQLSSALTLITGITVLRQTVYWRLGKIGLYNQTPSNLPHPLPTLTRARI